ncbi:DNA-binding protein [Sphingomonas sp. HF-S3]|uniref:DNA-binding protein n=1 Tax=Sphingomonas rustica TaxID=3103142 RepID=A0ABV0B373_9SPHN
MDGDDIDRATSAKRGSPFLNTDQAAAYLGISSRLLKGLRMRGLGPVFRRHSRFVHYHIEDLDTWSREHSARGTRS